MPRAVALSPTPSPLLPPALASLFAEPVEREVLPNQLTVVRQSLPGTGLASVQLWVRTGSIHEGHLLGAGVSHFVEHLFFKGTARHRGPAFARRLQEVGAYINAYTTFDRTVYYVDAPTEAVPVALELLAEAAAEAAFDAEEVAREADVIRREIDMGRDDPDREHSRSLFRAAFRVHPFRHPVIGSRELFDTVTPDELRGYYAARYQPANSVLVLAGDLGAGVDRAIASTFGAWKRGRLAPVTVEAEPDQLGPRVERATGDVGVVRGSLAFRIPSFRDPASPAIDLLAFGLGHGQTSWLWRRLREERRLVTHVDASAWNPGDAGLLTVNWITEPRHERAAAMAVREEIQAFAKEVNETTLARAWRQALSAEINSRKTVSGRASRLGLAEVVLGDLAYPPAYLRRLREVGVDAVRGAATAFLREDRSTEVTLAPKARASRRRRGSGSGTIVAAEAETRPNGSRLLWLRDPSLPRVHARVVFLGGPLYEPPSRRGVSGLMATLLARDTARRTAAEVAAAIEDAGGTFHEFSGNNSCGIGGEVLAGDEGLLLDLIEDGLVRPAFDPGTLARERDAQVAQIKEDLDEITEYGRKALRRHFFGQHPYRIGPYGLVETVERIGPADVKRHHREIVRAPNAVLALVGDYADESVLDRARALLDCLPQGSFKRLDSAHTGPSRPIDVREKLDREQAVVFEAYPDAGIQDPDYVAGEVLDEILSEMSGRLFSRVREELGLAYFVGAGRVVGTMAGMFYLSAGTRPDAVGRVQDEFARELLRLREEGPDPAELERCVTRLRVQHRQGLQTIGARAMQAALDLVYGHGLNAWARRDARLAAVGVSEVRDFAVRRLDPRRRVRLVVGP